MCRKLYLNVSLLGRESGISPGIALAKEKSESLELNFSMLPLNNPLNHLIQVDVCSLVDPGMCRIHQMFEC